MHTRNVLLFASSIVIASLGLAHDAHAQAEPRPLRWSEPGSSVSTPTAPPDPVEETKWYGWQTILVDGAALATIGIGGATGSGGVAGAGVGLYALGTPMVHAAHGRAEATIGDMGLRVGAPILFGALGYAIDYATTTCPAPKPGELFGGLCFRGLGGAAIGIVAGYVTAVIVDSAFIAREPVLRKPDQRDAYRVRWTPTVAVTPTGAAAGVGGTF